MADKLTLTFLTNKDGELIDSKLSGVNLFKDLNFKGEITRQAFTSSTVQGVPQGEVGDVYLVTNIDDEPDTFWVCSEVISDPGSMSTYTWEPLTVCNFIHDLTDGVIAPGYVAKSGRAVIGRDIYSYVQEQLKNMPKFLGVREDLNPEVRRVGDTFLVGGNALAYVKGYYVVTESEILQILTRNQTTSSINDNVGATSDNLIPLASTVREYVTKKLSPGKLFSGLEYKGILTQTIDSGIGVFSKVGDTYYHTQLGTLITCTEYTPIPGSTPIIEWDEIPVAELMRVYIENMPKATEAKEGNDSLVTSDLLYRTLTSSNAGVIHYKGELGSVPGGSLNASYVENDVIRVKGVFYITDGNGNWAPMSDLLISDITMDSQGRPKLPTATVVGNTDPGNFVSGKIVFCQYLDQYYILIAGTDEWLSIPIVSSVTSELSSIDTLKAVSGKAVADYVTSKTNTIEETVGDNSASIEDIDTRLTNKETVINNLHTDILDIKQELNALKSSQRETILMILRANNTVADEYSTLSSWISSTPKNGIVFFDGREMDDDGSSSTAAQAALYGLQYKVPGLYIKTMSFNDGDDQDRFEVILGCEENPFPPTESTGTE